jgi:hypothetical protein
MHARVVKGQPDICLTALSNARELRLQVCLLDLFLPLESLADRLRTFTSSRAHRGRMARRVRGWIARRPSSNRQSIVDRAIVGDSHVWFATPQTRK